MKPRTLLILVIALAALALFVFKRSRQEESVPAPELGQRVLHADDVNAIERVEITSGTQHVALARADGQWVVETMWNYPARFEQLASLLRELDRLRIGEVIQGGTQMLDEFGLTENGTNFPARIKLFGAGGTLVDDIIIGQPRVSAAMATGFSLPDSRYVRSGQGPVVLTEPFLDEPQRRPTDWIKSQLVSFQLNSVLTMAAIPASGDAYTIKRETNGDYTGSGSLEGKTINAASAEIWFRAFQSLSTRSIIDPAIPAETLARGSAGTAIAHLTNGIVVRAELGAQTSENLGHYGWLSFEYQEPPPLESTDTNTIAADKTARDAARAEVERLQAEYAPWTFVFDYSQVSKFIFLRDQLVIETTTNAPANP